MSLKAPSGCIDSQSDECSPYSRGKLDSKGLSLYLLLLRAWAINMDCLCSFKHGQGWNPRVISNLFHPEIYVAEILHVIGQSIWLKKKKRISNLQIKNTGWKQGIVLSAQKGIAFLCLAFSNHNSPKPRSLQWQWLKIISHFTWTDRCQMAARIFSHLIQLGKAGPHF